MTEPKSELAELEKTECVYLGQRQHGKADMVEAWIPLAALAGITLDQFDATVENRRTLFPLSKKNRRPQLVVGAVYLTRCKIEAGQITTIVSAGAEYAKLYDDAEARNRWDAIDRAEKTARRTGQMLDKVRATFGLESELNGLRAYYHRIPSADRTAFELLILSHIRKRG